MKKCNKCGIEKDNKEFYSRKLKNSIGLCSICISCSKKYYKKNRKRFLKEKKEYYINNKETLLKKHNKWKEKNLDYVKEYNKEYYKKNKVKHTEYKRNWENKRRKKDVEYKIKRNLKRQFQATIKRKNIDKNFSISKVIGESIKNIKIYLEKQFTNEMSWNNYGKYWHIDHIILQYLYDFTKDQEIKKCWNKRNLRPLFSKDNLERSKKLDMKLVKEYKIEDLLPEGYKWQK